MTQIKVGQRLFYFDYSFINVYCICLLLFYLNLDDMQIFAYLFDLLLHVYFLNQNFYAVEYASSVVSFVHMYRDVA